MLSAFTDRDYPFGDSCHNEVGHITCIQLVHQMTAVRINRIGRDTKFLSYLLRILTLGDAFQHIELEIFARDDTVRTQNSLYCESS